MSNTSSPWYVPLWREELRCIVDDGENGISGFVDGIEKMAGIRLRRINKII